MTKDIVYKSFGELVKIRRLRLELRQQDVCKLTGIDPSTYSSIETGRMKLYLHNVLKVTTALNINIGELQWLKIHDSTLPDSDA